jgi:hypothetical protein
MHLPSLSRTQSRALSPNQTKPQTKNNANRFSVVVSLGGLGSYTPSKIQISEAPFQLGVSRTTPTAAVTSSSSASVVADSPPSSLSPKDPFLLPADEGLSWGNAATADMLF